MNCTDRRSDQIPSAFFPARQDLPRRRQPDGVVLEPLNFPATKAVLWNRTPQGSQETLQLTSERNIQLMINEKTLWIAQRHCTQKSSPFECFLVGSISVNSNQDGIDLIIDRFDPGREIVIGNIGSPKVKRKVPTTIVPGDHILPITLVSGLNGAENSATHSQTEFQNCVKLLHSRISSHESLSLSNLVIFKACCHIHASEDEVIYNLHCAGVALETSILATPICSVPIIPTALARNLSGPLRLSELQGTPKCGFLTMDHTRKLLLLLESDPKAHSLPLVGCWVSGAYSVHHPFVWACCMRYLHSTELKDRVFASPGAFLLLLYSPVSAAPEFWECAPHQEPHNGGTLFQLYSCRENLHVETPPNSKSAEPLRFELLPAVDGTNDGLFRQAVECWVQEQEQASPAAPATADVTAGPSAGTLVEPEDGARDEEHTPLPRPSPSPHPQGGQHHFDLSTIPEVSLSLSFDETCPQDIGIPAPYQTKNVLAPTRSAKLHVTGQENVGTVAKKLPPAMRQVMTPARPGHSPVRQPLRQITSPNQLAVPRQPVNRRPEIQKGNGHQGKDSAKPRAPDHRRMSGSTKTRNQSSSNQRSRSHSLPADAGFTRGARTSSPPDEHGLTSVEQNDRHFLQRTMSAGEASSDPAASSLQAGDCDNAFEEADLENQEQGVSSDERRSHTHQGADCPGGAENGNSARQTSLPLDAEQLLQNGPSRELVQTTDSREYAQQPHRNGEELGKGARDLQETTTSRSSDRNNDKGGDNGGGGSGAGEGDGSAEPQPNPYQLLMQQQMQLQQLQAQIQLLLKQQNPTLPTPAGLLTPPRTPAPASDQDLTPQPRDPTAKVSVCTSTGASLMMCTPVKDPGKRSAATSPLGYPKSARPCSKCDREREGSPENLHQNEPANGVDESPGAVTGASRQAAQSPDDSNASLNADGDNLTVVVEDPSQSLASSLNAVDIQSFYGSPSPTRKGNNSSAALDFPSPLLGESASVVLEHRKDATPTSLHEAGHDNLVRPNEREFYDNLLDQVKHLLEQQNDGPADDSRPAHERATPEDSQKQAEEMGPSPEEVAKATAEELEKLVKPVLPSGTLFKSVGQERQLSLMQFSASPSPLSPYPRINYVSIAVDETMDEVFSEADHIALKYLSEQQLTELRHQAGQRRRSVRLSDTSTSTARLMLGHSETVSVSRHERSGYTSVIGGSDYTWNNLSFATRKYLGKYHLAPAGRVDTTTDSEERGRSAGVSAGGANKEADDAAEKDLSIVSQTCEAPPPTPEPHNEEPSNILDIGRLKKLPKLF